VDALVWGVCFILLSIYRGICEFFFVSFVRLEMEKLTCVDSLCKKFTASGVYYDDAIRYLNTLDLVQLAEETGANDFASKARVLSVTYLQARASR
jgi:hypothetical protein